MKITILPADYGKEEIITKCSAANLLLNQGAEHSGARKIQLLITGKTAISEIFP